MGIATMKLGFDTFRKSQNQIKSITESVNSKFSSLTNKLNSTLKIGDMEDERSIRNMSINNMGEI
jgi:hypothetical protein